MEFLERISRFLNRAFVFVGGIFLLGMIALTCGNIAARLMGSPIQGTYELMGYFGAVAAAFALGYTQMKRGHIAVDVLVLSFSKRFRRLLNAVNSLICLAFMILCSWQLGVKAGILWRTGEVTETLRIIYYPFTYAAAAGCAVLAAAFLLDFLQAVASEKGGER